MWQIAHRGMADGTSSPSGLSATGCWAAIMKKATHGVSHGSGGIGSMLFILYYIIAITILALHFTGFLARHNLEWLVLVLAVTVFPAVIYL